MIRDPMRAAEELDRYHPSRRAFGRPMESLRRLLKKNISTVEAVAKLTKEQKQKKKHGVMYRSGKNQQRVAIAVARSNTSTHRATGDMLGQAPDRPELLQNLRQAKQKQQNEPGRQVSAKDITPPRR